MSEQESAAFLLAIWTSCLQECKRGERFGVESLHNYTRLVHEEIEAAGWSGPLALEADNE